MTQWLSSNTPRATDFILDGPTRKVSGALWLPESLAPDAPLMLMGHGASGNRYQAPIPHLAKRFLNEAGIPTLAIDGPVHGLRQVGVGGREAFFSEMRREGCIDDMVADWQCALQMVQQEKAVGRARLGYFGLSMGNMFGMPLLAAAADFSASVLGLCGTIGAAANMSERLVRDAKEITHPVLFLMQLEDELFPRDGYLELFDALASEDKRLHANPGLHPEVPAEEIDFSFRFLADRLTGTVDRRIVNPLAQ